MSSYNHNFLFSRMYIAFEIPMTCMDRNNNVSYQVGYDGYPEFCLNLREKCTSQTIPTIYIEDETFIYGLFIDSMDNLYVAGPIVLSTPSLTEVDQYLKKYNLSEDFLSFPVKSYMNIANYLSIVFWEVTGLEVTEEAILTGVNENGFKKVQLEEINKYLFEKAINDFEHLSYRYELEYLNAIENGNVKYFKNTYSVDPNAIDKVGKLASNSTKQIEYMCLSSIVLVTRAAVRGGLNPSVAYALSELYMQKLELCSNSKEILSLHNSMKLDFVSRVKEIKDKKIEKNITERVKDYIQQNLHYSLKVSEIAENLGISHSYLSKKFKAEEGITIVRYIILARLDGAANMLKYSEMSIAEISDYYCFVSQSRFGSQFKEVYHLTPNAYRKKYRVIDLIRY